MPEFGAICRLYDAGLLVEAWEDGSAHPGGYSVAKPVFVHGNSRGYVSTYWYGHDDGDDIQIDGPNAILYRQQGKWIFKVHEYVPGPGPGDFEKEYDSLEKVVDAIIEYYFGDPSFMNPPELAKWNSTDPFWETLKESELVAGSVCKRDECRNERMHNSVFCRTHHYEHIKGELPPGGRSKNDAASEGETTFLDSVFARVVLQNGPNQGEDVALKKDCVVIGRHPTCDIHLDTARSSRYHAQLVRTPDGYSIQDLDSRCGTYLNGHPAAGRQALTDGDCIRIAEVELAYRIRYADKQGRVLGRRWTGAAGPALIGKAD